MTKMNNTLKTGSLIIAAFVGLAAVSYVGLQWGGFLAKTQESIRYDVTKESAAYRDGMQRNLVQMQTQYLTGDDTAKAAISAAVKQQYSQTDTSEYPQYLKDFLITFGIY